MMPYSLNQNIGNQIRVLIVDDHAVVRAGLRLFLKACQDMELVGEAANGEEAVELCDRVQPDVVLMDLMMPRLDGVEAIRIIRQNYPKIQFIALVNFGEEEGQLKALDVGASSYLLKNISADRLAEAIRAAYTDGPGTMAGAARV